MSSPSGTYNKNAPPVPVSTSLEGLEIGVPPPKRAPPPCLEKPLPKLPDRTSSICGFESSGCEIVEIIDHNNDHDHHPSGRKRATSESPEPPGRFYRRRNIDHRNSITRPNERSSINLKTFLLEDQHGVVRPQLAKANHYFREKKWDIFPELAPHSARCETPLVVGTPKSASSASSPKKSPIRPKLPRGFSRQQIYHQGEVFGVNLKPVANQIQQTIVSKTSQLRSRKKPSQASIPESVPVVLASRSRNNSSSSNNDSDTTTLVGIIDSSDFKRSVAMMRQRVREMAPWSRSEPSSADDVEGGGSISLWKSTSTSVLNLVSSLETKVPVSSFKLPKSQTKSAVHGDEEGPTISLWKSTSTSVLNLVSSLEAKVPISPTKLSKSQSQPVDVNYSDATAITTTTTTVSEIDDPPSKVVTTTTTRPILAIQTHFDASVVSLPEHTSKTIREKHRNKSISSSSSKYVLIALDGAKRKLAAVQAARRRAELKKHIRVVGPIDKYPDGSINQWV